MSTPSGVPQAPVSAGGVEGQAAVIGELQQKEMYSLRFDGSSYLKRTSDSNGNSNTWTYSLWAKRTNLESNMHLLSEEGGAHVGGTDISFCSFRNTDVLNNYFHYSGTKYDVRSTAVYRDTNSWYHIVFVLDLTNSMAGDRETIYVNGKLVSDVHTVDGSASNPSRINSGHSVLIGNESARYRYPFKGYLANIHFIDGEALEPSSFGELISDVWRPASYSGDYGVNGFHLDFDPDNMVYDSNGKLTQVKDASGNDNHWTAN